MCIIVDANRLGSFLQDPPNEDARPIRDWLEKKGGLLIYSTGDDFAREMGHRQRRRLASYVQAGRARIVPAAECEDDRRALQSSGDLRSDDPHVLALARKTGTRLLYTSDRNLMSDFLNKRIIDKPRGKIYSGAGNADLLVRNACTIR